MTFQAYLDNIKAQTGVGPDEWVKLATKQDFQPKTARGGQPSACRERNHGHAGSHRDTNAERAVHCGPAATHVVVVHARQIVVDK